MQLFRFFKKFITKPPTLLGIDLDHSFLRLVALSRIDGTYLLQSCSHTPLPSQNVAKKFSWDHPDFPDFLKQVVQKSNVTTNQTALALPHASVLFKTIELDRTLSEAEIAMQIRDHAEQYFNYPLSELMMDFELLGTSKNHPDLCEVRWVAAKRLEIESRVRVLTAAGLTAAVIEVDSFSLQRAATFFINKKHPQSDIVAVIQIYFSSILLIALCQGQSVYIRVENYATNMHEDVMLTAGPVILRMLQLFLTSVAADRLSLILLSGSNIPADLLGHVQTSIGIATHYLDIFSVLEQSIQYKEYSAHAFSVSTGLAMWINT